MRGRRSLFSLQGWRDLVSDSMAIDIGSTSVIIAVRGRGVVVDEPAVVAVNKISGEVVAVGREAHDMLGREARDASLVYPLVDGVVADFERTRVMLDQFVRRARSGISHFSRRAVMSVLSGITQVEQRALMSAAEQAHIGRVYMVEEGLAAAIGAGVSIEDKNASGVVDIGGGTTNVAVVARGMIVYAARSLSVKGRDVQTGAPRAVDVTSEEVCIAAEGVIKRLSRVVNRALGELQPEVAADIYDRGLILTGGGALFDGMAEFLQRETNLQTRMPPDPRYAIVNGLSQLFDEPLLLRRVARNEQSHMLDEAAGAFE